MCCRKQDWRVHAIALKDIAKSEELHMGRYFEHQFRFEGNARSCWYLPTTAKSKLTLEKTTPPAGGTKPDAKSKSPTKRPLFGPRPYCADTMATPLEVGMGRPLFKTSRASKG